MKIQFTRDMLFAKKAVKTGQIIDVAKENTDAILSLRAGWAVPYEGKKKPGKADGGDAGDGEGEE